MKTLYLVRHAKSEKDFKNVQDYDRPLTERGIHDANMIAELLSSKSDIPDLIITSPANRAISTALIFGKEFNMAPNKFILDDSIYEAMEKDIVNIIENTSDKYGKIMLFGHNPAFTEVCNHYITPSIENMPTSAVMRIDFDINSWKETAGRKGKLVYLETPKQVHQHNES
jgi:phosphohistidine phosphatase